MLRSFINPVRDRLPKAAVSRLRRLISNGVNALVDILYPKICPVCKNKLDGSSVENLVCPKCWSKIKMNMPPFCHFCGRHLEYSNYAKNICRNCLTAKFYFDRAFSPCVYEGVIKELIHNFKYKGKDYLGAPLSKLMIEFIKEYNMPMDYLDYIVPIPLHKTKLREREFNQAQILSEYIADEFNKTLLPDALIRHRQTKTQTDLEINQRLLNVNGCFSINKQRDIKGRNLLLVDDVLTTKATSSEAAKILKDAGAGIVFVLALAN